MSNMCGIVSSNLSFFKQKCDIDVDASNLFNSATEDMELFVYKHLEKHQNYAYIHKLLSSSYFSVALFYLSPNLPYPYMGVAMNFEL